MGYTKNKKPGKYDAKAELAKEKKEADDFASAHESAIKAGEEGRKELAEKEAKK